MSRTKIVSLAFYLPQFHPTPENDAWWEPGFTEWTHMRRAAQRFEGHAIRKPVPPLGEYSLRDPSVFERQMAIARDHGIDAFFVWDYWLGDGKRLLDAPLELVLRERPDFIYALAWANHDWIDRARGRILCKQRYLGARDYEKYFRLCLRHFVRDEYVKVDGRPLFYILEPRTVPNLREFTETFERLAVESGFAGMYFIGDRLRADHEESHVVDAYADGFRFWTTQKKLYWNYVKEKMITKLKFEACGPLRFDFYSMVRDAIPKNESARFVPTVITGWDTTPRHGRRGAVLENFDSASFARHLEDVAALVRSRSSPATQVVLVKSWNEWAEGNLLEPDSVHGTSILRAYQAFVQEFERPDESRVRARVATNLGRELSSTPLTTDAAAAGRSPGGAS